MKAFRFFCCFLPGLLAALVPGYAQTLAPAHPAEEVSGRVRGAATGQSVEFASVALLRAADAGVVQATYTDNANRSESDPQDALILGVSPGFTLSSEGSRRVKATLQYGLRGVTRFGDQNSESLYHNLNANHYG